MCKVSIAVDIGASGGRMIAGSLVDGKITTQEIYRFKNGIVHIGDHDYWDIDAIFNHIKTGLKEVANLGIEPVSVGIDTWAVDYVLLDDENKRVAPVYAYRDHRTDHTMDEFFTKITAEETYKKTGVQFLQINTIYQLAEHVRQHAEEVKKASCLLMVPDYLHFLLCGVKQIEFTNATTTQLYNINGYWDEDLLDAVGISSSIFPQVVEAGTILGDIAPDLCYETRITGKPEAIEIAGKARKSGEGGRTGVKVIAPATHDTGSAIVSIPTCSEDFAYISSGTWSLMGIERNSPICSAKAMEYNFTNEGGAFHTYRVLKNIMGLWLIQEVQRNYEYKYSFDEFVMLAEQAEPFVHLIDPNHPRFLNPVNMVEEIRSFCGETGQPVPNMPGEIARCIFESLAFAYRKVLTELREIQSGEINRIHIIGGGSKNRLLNQLCADFTNCQVFAGPKEATALGNLAVQFIALGQIESVKKAREIIASSFSVEQYLPMTDNVIEIEENWNRYRLILEEGKICQ